MTEDRRQASRVCVREAHIRARTPLIVAAACLLGLALIWVCAALIGTLHRADASAVHYLLRRSTPRVDNEARSLTRLLSPKPYILWSAILIAIACLRRRPRLALAAVAIVTLAPLTAEVAKPVMAHSHAQIGFGRRVPADSWPSGHAAAALALASAAVIVSPIFLRPGIAVIGITFAIAVGFCQVLLARHMPSDVLAGYLVVLLWAALAYAALARGSPH
jgi:membrane-associated phospholipid phosphatase